MVWSCVKGAVEYVTRPRDSGLVRTPSFIGAVLTRVHIRGGPLTHGGTSLEWKNRTGPHSVQCLTSEMTFWTNGQTLPMTLLNLWEDFQKKTVVAPRGKHNRSLFSVKFIMNRKY